MGQQQLLLVILGVILVAVAVAVGLSLFKVQAEAVNRDAIWSDLNQLGARAQAYYRRPSALGGGGKSFLNFTLLDREMHNENGGYDVAERSADFVILRGTGTEIGKDGENPVEINLRVEPDTIYVDDGRVSN